MKKYLLVTTMLAASVGAAQADVSVSGDARMGISTYDPVAKAYVKPSFVSRARVRFSLSSETDAGYKVGAQFRAADASKANEGTKGTVFFEMPGYGRLTMGDSEGAVQTAVTQFGAIGYDELNKYQEFTFLTGGETGSGTDLNYTFTKDALTVALSMGNPGTIDGMDATDPGKANAKGGDDRAIGVSYTTEFWKVAAGWETNGPVDQTVVSGSYGNGQAEVKVAYGRATSTSTYYPGSNDRDQFVVYGTYILGHTTFNAFWREDDVYHKSQSKAVTTRGVAANLDLGGGMSVIAGYGKQNLKKPIFSIGTTMSF